MWLFEVSRGGGTNLIFPKGSDQVGKCLDAEVGESHCTFGAVAGSVDPDQSGLRVHSVDQVSEEGFILTEHLGEAGYGGDTVELVDRRQGQAA